MTVCSRWVSWLTVLLDIETADFNIFINTTESLTLKMGYNFYRSRPALLRAKNIRAQITPDHRVIAIKPTKFQANFLKGSYWHTKSSTFWPAATRAAFWSSQFTQSTMPSFMKTGVNRRPHKPPP